MTVPGGALDDFSARRLKELPKLGDVHRDARDFEWYAVIGMLVTTYTRHELDIIRAAGYMSPRERRLLGQLDQSWAEYFALQGDSDTSRCAHCGDDITRARKVITIDLLGCEYLFHEARPACARAARRIGTISSTRGGGGLLGDTPEPDDATIVTLRRDDR